MTTMVAIRLPDNIGERLTKLATKTGRTKTFYVREAVLRFIEEMEDMYVAVQRLKKPAKRISMKEAEKLLGLED